MRDPYNTVTASHASSGGGPWRAGFAALALCASCVSPTPPAAPGPAGPETKAAGTTTPAPAATVPGEDKVRPKAGTGDNVITLGVRASLTSQILGEERGYLVYTPPGYETGEQRYPVMYLFDGDAHFHHVTGIIDFLAQQGHMPQILVVGVSNTDRARDFTPTREERFPSSGGADKFLSFLATELMPTIDRQYRVLPYRIIVGHSLGGLLAIYTLLSQPDMFQAYVAISPSLQWDRELLLRNAQAAWSRDKELDRFLYFTLGTEPENITAGNRNFAAFLDKRAPAKLRWSYHLMEREDHGSTPHKTVYDGLQQLFEGWRLPRDVDTLAGVQAHYRALSQRFGMDVRVPEGSLNNLGYQLLGTGKMAEAIQAFELNIKLYPTSPNVYDSLGEALEKNGDLKGAHRNYAEATKRAAAARDPQLELFMANRDRVAKKLTEEN